MLSDCLPNGNVEKKPIDTCVTLSFCLGGSQSKDLALQLSLIAGSTDIKSDWYRLFWYSCLGATHASWLFPYQTA